jgi:hypothetical protein
METNEPVWYLVVLNQRPYAVLLAENEVWNFLKKTDNLLAPCKGKQYGLPRLMVSTDAFGQEVLMEKPAEDTSPSRNWNNRD